MDIYINLNLILIITSIILIILGLILILNNKSVNDNIINEYEYKSNRAKRIFGYIFLIIGIIVLIYFIYRLFIIFKIKSLINNITKDPNNLENAINNCRLITDKYTSVNKYMTAFEKIVAENAGSDRNQLIIDNINGSQFKCLKQIKTISSIMTKLFLKY